MVKIKHTERTFYPPLITILQEDLGAPAASEQEIVHGSQPDILFEFCDKEWILSVKMGKPTEFPTGSWAQYIRHKAESGLEHGLLLVLDKEILKSKAKGTDLVDALRKTKCAIFIDIPQTSGEEISNTTFPQILQKIQHDIVPKLKLEKKEGFELKIVIKSLKEQTLELMDNIKLNDQSTLKIITDKELLTGIGHLSLKEANQSARFLAAYIIISQILFLRLFSRTRPYIVTEIPKKISQTWLRTCFEKILQINYDPIFKIDVLDAVSEKYLHDTFTLIWGLQVEKHQLDLPGRIFHELMDHKVRKILAAFYTRPIAAELLARLTISKSSQLVIDPACGSGTILVAAYKRKNELAIEEKITNNCHKQFCENDIFGSEIMPFGVHLSTANLASMNTAETIDKAQIIEGDSLKLSKGIKYKSGIQTTLFSEEKVATNMKGEKYPTQIPDLDVVLMNPPFTKMERGIQKFVDVNRFGNICGKEVGLWGHFIMLADDLLKPDGLIGAVIPISILTGRETDKIRNFIFDNLTPIYIIKSTLNYGFSENSEHRDILLIVKKKKPSDDDPVKVVLIKKDLSMLTSEDISHFANQIEVSDTENSREIDIQTFKMKELKDHITNLMWCCNLSDMKSRKTIVELVEKISKKLEKIPDDYLRDGFAARPEGTSKFMYLTNTFQSSRLEKAFLRFDRDDNVNTVTAKTELGREFTIKKSALLASLRTPVGLNTLKIDSKLDYVAKEPYLGLDEVMQASGFDKKRINAKEFWNYVSSDLKKIQTNIVTSERIDPTSPETRLIAFFSEKKFSPSNILNVVKENDLEKAKAFCIILNSIIFLSQYYLYKQDTTARYAHIRQALLKEMNIFSSDTNVIKNLSKVFDKYSETEFPPLREQLDQNFEKHYNQFWEKIKHKAKSSTAKSLEYKPSELRINFDIEVCKALGIKITKEELENVYEAIVKNMIVSRGLNKS